MADTFSCTLAFKSSYLRNTTSKIFVVHFTMRASTQPSTMMAVTNTRLNLALVAKHMAMLHSSMKGARTAILRIIW